MNGFGLDWLSLDWLSADGSAARWFHGLPSYEILGTVGVLAVWLLFLFVIGSDRFSRHDAQNSPQATATRPQHDSTHPKPGNALRAYYRDANAELLASLEKERWPYKEFTSAQGALRFAQQVLAAGTAVLAVDAAHVQPKLKIIAAHDNDVGAAHDNDDPPPSSGRRQNHKW